MLRRIRLGFRHVVQRLGALLVAIASLSVLGFGAHAALDWHRHGSTGSAFFHLHVHFGHHHHDEADHHEHETPESDSGSERRHCGTLTMALGVAPAPAVAAAEKPTLEADDRALDGIPKLTDSDSGFRPWSPRAPPV